MDGSIKHLLLQHMDGDISYEHLEMELAELFYESGAELLARIAALRAALEQVRIYADNEEVEITCKDALAADAKVTDGSDK